MSAHPGERLVCPWCAKHEPWLHEPDVRTSDRPYVRPVEPLDPEPDEHEDGGEA